MRRFGSAYIVAQRFGQLFHRFEVGCMRGLVVLEPQVLLAHDQQPPARGVVAFWSQRQRPRDVRQHGLVGVACGSVLGGAAEKIAGACSIPGMLEMLGCQPQDFARAVPAKLVQPGSDPRVVVAPLAFEHAVVCHLVQYLMPEHVFAQPVEGVRVARMGKFAFDQRAEHLDRTRVERGQGLVPEHEAHHGGLLQRQLLGCRQAVQACLQDARQGGRNMRSQQFFGHHFPAVGVGDDGPVVEQHLHQLFHVEGVALGGRRDHVAQCGGHGVEPLQQLQRQLPAGTFVERLQVDSGEGRLDAGPTAAALEQGRSREAQQERRHVAVDLEQVVDEVERAFVSPMNVVQHDHRGMRSLLGHAAHRLRGGVKGAIAKLLGVVKKSAHMWAERKVEPDQVAQHMCLRLAVITQQRGDPVDQLAARGVGVVAVGNLQSPRQHVAQKRIRLLFVERLGSSPKHENCLWLRLRPVLEFVQQAAFADSGFRHDDHGHQLARLVDGSESILQLLKLGVAPDHAGREAFDTAGCDPKRPRFGAVDQVGNQGLVAALDKQRRLFEYIEHAADVPVGVVADAQPTRRRGLLHARSRVDGDPAHAVLFIHPPAEQDRAGADAHPHAEIGAPMAAADLSGDTHCVCKHRQPRMHGTLRIVFVRALGTEHGQHAVARVLQDATLVHLDDRREALESAVHDQVDVFRVEVLAQVGRADHVHEQNSGLFQLLAGRQWLCRRGWQSVEFGAQRCHRHVHHGVTQNCPLRLDRGDAGVDLSVLRHDPIMHVAGSILAHRSSSIFMSSPGLCRRPAFAEKREYEHLHRRDAEDAEETRRKSGFNSASLCVLCVSAVRNFVSCENRRGTTRSAPTSRPPP